MASWILNCTRAAAPRGTDLPTQARELLAAGLWGIPEASRARERLRVGDRVLVYVGAPHRILVGTATVTDGWHLWSAAEAARLPEGAAFEAGVTLADAHTWEEPLPLADAWPATQGAWTNPRPVWHGAAIRLIEEDCDLLLATAAAPRAAVALAAAPAARAAPLTKGPPRARPAPGAGRRRRAASTTAVPPASARAPPTISRPSDALFETAVQLRDFRTGTPAATADASNTGVPTPGRQLTEASTRAFLVDRQLAALGFRDFEDVDHGAAVPSGDVPDYVLRANGAPVMAVEARRLGHALGPREASQLVKYCSVLGLRWGLLTDGRLLQVYDAPLTGVAPDQRLIVEVDLDDWRDRDDFDRRVWPRAAMLTKAALHEGGALERWAARERIRALLSDRGSRTIRALQRELRAEKVLLDAEALVALTTELIA